MLFLFSATPHDLVCFMNCLHYLIDIVHRMIVIALKNIINGISTICQVNQANL